MQALLSNAWSAISNGRSSRLRRHTETTFDSVSQRPRVQRFGGAPARESESCRPVDRGDRGLGETRIGTHPGWAYTIPKSRALLRSRLRWASPDMTATPQEPAPDPDSLDITREDALPAVDVSDHPPIPLVHRHTGGSRSSCGCPIGREAPRSGWRVPTQPPTGGPRCGPERD